MTICGYNDKIGEGLRILIEGMVQALEEKAESVPVKKVLEREIVELEAMISTMRHAHGETLPEMFVGLNVLAKALFERVRENLEASKDRNLGSECRGVGEAFVNLLADAERRTIQRRLMPGAEEPPEKLATELAVWVLGESKEREGKQLLNT